MASVIAVVYRLPKAKGEAPVDKFIIHFKQLTCSHYKEILREASLRLVEN